MTSKIRLDGRELIDTYELIIPRKMRCEVDIFIGNAYVSNPITLPLSIAFVSDNQGQNVSFTPDNGRSLMTLINWDNSLGTTLNSPHALAKIEQEGTIDLMIANYAINDVNHLTLQIWWRKLNAQFS